MILIVILVQRPLNHAQIQSLFFHILLDVKTKQLSLSYPSQPSFKHVHTALPFRPSHTLHSLPLPASATPWPNKSFAQARHIYFPFHANFLSLYYSCLSIWIKPH